ncbi:MAG: phenylacetic acid degradation operon negative regulatory protein [Actinomycetota bacterium]|jgi:phenylacetic acid degradation operon negative regulatory protein|nr:phenylacetic acid degradation operon negative regulatory protein [Actinomycetota bacterium]
MSSPSDASGANSRTARTFLLTILGDAVMPGSRRVLQESLVGALGALDISVPAARQATSRATRDGWLTSERVGRRSLMTISDSAAEMLIEGRKRTMEFGETRPWDERWLLVTLTVHEDRREVRHHFRTELGWLGFGSLGNGVWISPHASNEAAALRLFQSREGLKDAYVFVTSTPVTHAPRDIARTAWDLDKLLRRYTAFDTKFSALSPSDPREIFAAWIELITAWRHFPLVDPELPDSLLPAGWPRETSYRLFHRRREEWAAVAREYFLSLDPG